MAARVALHPEKHIPDLIKQARTVVGAMSASKYFPSPPVSYALVSKHADALEILEAQMETSKGLKPARDGAKHVLESDLRHLKEYVQEVADADPPNAEKIIAAAAMSLHQVADHAKHFLSAKPGKKEGVVHVVGPAGAHRAAAHAWRYSVDGGKTHIDVEPTLHAETTLTGLPSGTRIEVQHKLITADAKETWGDPVSVMVP